MGKQTPSLSLGKAPSSTGTLTYRELDAEIAEKVMGEPRCKCEYQKRITAFHFYDPFTGKCKTCGFRIPDRYSTDRNAAALALEQIGKMGLCRQFEMELGIGSAFEALMATPRRLMEAALAAVDR